jgi:transposase-like protein
VPQTCQTNIRWERRPHVAASRVAQNDNHAGDGLCPVCKGYASIAPMASEYCGNGLVHRHWLCRVCGHEWVTVLHVLA